MSGVFFVIFQCVFMCVLYVSVYVVGDEWPSRGEIVMENVSLCYDESLGPVVRDISLTIPGGNKVLLIIRRNYIMHVA